MFQLKQLKNEYHISILKHKNQQVPENEHRVWPGLVISGALKSDSDPLSAVYLADTVILQTVGESKKAALNLKKSRSHTSTDLML